MDFELGRGNAESKD